MVPSQPDDRGGAPLQARAQRTRRHILDLAARAFAEGGYDGASLNDIVRGSGLTKGAFYFHFASKEQLALAVFEDRAAELVRRLAASVHAEDALEAIAEVLRARARLLLKEPSFGAVLQLGGRLASMTKPGSEFSSEPGRPIGFFAEIIERGQRAGSVRPDLGAREAAEFVFAVMVGLDEASYTISAGKDLVQRTERALDVLLAGLAASPRPQGRERARAGKAAASRLPGGPRPRPRSRRRLTSAE